MKQIIIIYLMALMIYNITVSSDERLFCISLLYFIISELCDLNVQLIEPVTIYILQICH